MYIYIYINVYALSFLKLQWKGFPFFDVTHKSCKSFRVDISNYNNGKATLFGRHV